MPKEKPGKPIEADRLSLRFAGNDAVIDKQSKPLLGIVLQIDSFSPSDPEKSVSATKFNDFKKKVENSGQRIEDLSEIAGFLAFARIGEQQCYRGPFAAVPGGSVTPDGYPIIFDCGGDIISSRDCNDLKRVDPTCRVRYARSSGVALMYDFSEGRMPIEDWADLDRSVQAFVRNMAIQTQP